MTSRYNLRSRRNAASMEVDIPVTDLKSQKRNVSSRKHRQKSRTTSPNVFPTQTAMQADGAFVQFDGASGGRSPDSPVSDSLPTAARATRDQTPAICNGCQEYCSPFPVGKPGYEKDTLPCVEVNLTSAELRLLPFRFQLSGANCDIHLPDAMHNSQQRGFEIYRRKPWFH